MTVPYPRETYYAEVVALRLKVDVLQATLAEYRKRLAPLAALPASWKLTASESRVVSTLAGMSLIGATMFSGIGAADGPRYKACGNSMAVPVVRWILSRLAAAHRALPASEAA